MIRKALPLIVITALLSGCQFQCSVGNTDSAFKTKTVTTTDGEGVTGAIIKNDIELEATGIKVSKAYLMNVNRELLETNVVATGEKVICTVEFDTGWTKINGSSFIGASEKITGSNGKVLLDAADLFKQYDSTGLPEKIARLINLSAVVSEKIPGVDSYSVSFRIWDKRGSGEVRGKFKITVL